MSTRAKGRRKGRGRGTAKARGRGRGRGRGTTQGRGRARGTKSNKLVPTARKSTSTVLGKRIVSKSISKRNKQFKKRRNTRKIGKRKRRRSSSESSSSSSSSRSPVRPPTKRFKPSGDIYYKLNQGPHLPHKVNYNDYNDNYHPATKKYKPKEKVLRFKYFYGQYKLFCICNAPLIVFRVDSDQIHCDFCDKLIPKRAKCLSCLEGIII